METDKREIILFTGQSGIEAVECLNRISRQIKRPTHILSVEERMSEISRRSFRKEILLEDIFYQHGLWNQAFSSIIDDIDKSEFDDNLIFLTLHGVYYHQDKREFVSPIDPETISKLKGRVKALIILVDDIFDIYRRLMEDNEMFNQVMKLDKLKAVYESTFNLITILEWRQIEITISRIIQRILDVPMYIIATKHPASMIGRLISMPLEQLQVFYLSHPISSIRDEATERMPGFLGELNMFVRQLILEDNLVLFLPAAIDELIIKRDGDTFIPECSPRWSLPHDDGASICPGLPAHLRKIEPLNPLDYSIASVEMQQPISYLMNLLWDYISVHTTSRDLSLVEQSNNGVIAYRPYFPDVLSGGARREIEHNHKLFATRKVRKSIVISVIEDEGKARIKRFFTVLETLVKELDDGVKTKLEEKQQEWTSDGSWVKIFSEDTVLKSEVKK